MMMTLREWNDNKTTPIGVTAVPSSLRVQINDGESDSADSPSENLTSFRTVSNKLRRFGEHLISWTSWKINSMQLRSNSHLFVTPWMAKFRLWAKQWKYKQLTASFFIRAWTPLCMPLMHAAASYAWPTQLAVDREHRESTSFMTWTLREHLSPIEFHTAAVAILRTDLINLNQSLENAENVYKYVLNAVFLW